MSLKAGIVGLPNVGKSTLFSALTKYQVEASNYAFTTIEPNVSSVPLKDKRLYELAKLVNPNKIVPATFDFVDIAGLVQGASRGEGLGNKFLGNIREVDAIIHVVRCFDDKNIMHVANEVNPVNDKDVINMELNLADLDTIKNVLNRISKKAKSGDKTALIEQNLCLKIQELLEQGKAARELKDINEEEAKILKGYHLLTFKPMIYVANMSAEQIADYENATLFKMFKASCSSEEKILPICVQLESEISQLDENEAQEWLQTYEIKFSGLDLLTREAFDLLKLKTYFTVGQIEVRAWVFHDGMLAPQCAGIIHTDFENKFIKADVITYEDFVELGSEQAVKAAGKIRSEGKNYVMKDGDICHFKFGK
ncbi:redox-regulated ATPase YchF [Mycoplasma zalophidermidis]|uniref:Ribosome-binding ATPase YchF n=1 Tax=Mycoplasma zalophidermidis TaxID=398174 RepID=A0ABS6DSF0_9MOLU|nr:redox-regulated ATPase YchF [Mycoplasma zalophidermidis]MBU4689795.1 redox-regulated ATPase YchF [Mycoplasma zalophidermidis]MBU4693940.1 redox-regulated ATPase YchF [Mycoplasma zalophidermidis]MCR8966580.1 redox-regulated ATPase YchF [Mycoplasma zalophidermidis]